MHQFARRVLPMSCSDILETSFYNSRTDFPESACGQATLLHPKYFVSFPRIPFPKTIKLRIIKGHFSCTKEVVQNVSL